MRKTFQYAMLAALALGLSVSAAAQQVRVFQDANGAWVEETRGELPAGKQFRLETPMGAVVVQGRAQNNVTYTVTKRVQRGSEEYARQQFQRFRVQAATRAHSAVLSGEIMQRIERLSATFTVQVPQGTEVVRVQTAGGSVSASNIQGEVNLSTSGGSISADKIGGRVVGRTAGGSVSVGSADGDIRVETAGGSINVGRSGGLVRATTFGGSIQLGECAGPAVLQTHGGSIQVKKSGGELRAITAGGNIDVHAVNGPARLETAGGSIRVHSAQGRVIANTAGGRIHLTGLTQGARAETAAGGIHAEFTNAGAFAESYLGTTMGDVIVVLPESLAVTVRAAIEAAKGHKIISDFKGLRITSEGGTWGPREVFGEGALNGGGPLLKVHTTAGNIEFRRAKR